MHSQSQFPNNFLQFLRADTSNCLLEAQNVNLQSSLTSSDYYTIWHFPICTTL